MKNLFEPWSLGTLRIKNRIIRSATHEGMALRDGMPTDGLEKLYQRLAAGGAGAIITGFMCVKGNGRMYANIRMFDHDGYIDVYKGINDRLKELGTPVIAQLAHGGSRSSKKLTGEDVIGPMSRRKNESGDAVKEASEADIVSIIDAFVAAVVRARKAGFDGVQIHAAHGYLLSEFLSPNLNRRRDKWGGTVENRLRIVTEILRRARQEAGSYPVLVKISAHDQFRNGLTEHDAVATARLLQESGCDAIEVSCGYGDFLHTVRMPKVPIDALLGMMPGYRERPAFQKRLLRAIAPFLGKIYTPLHNYNVHAAEATKRAVTVPVIVVGGIRTLQDITEIISRKDIDCVSLSRPFIIEPDIVERFRQGKQGASRCIDCGYCLIGVAGAPLRCYYGRVPDRG